MLMLTAGSMLFLYSMSLLLQFSSKANGQHVVTTVPVGHNPRGIAYNPDYQSMYVTLYGDCSDGPGGPTRTTISIINLDGTTNSYRITEDCPQDIAYNMNNHQMYVTNYGDETVSVIVGTQERSRITDGIEDGPIGIAYNPENRKIYVANSEDSDVTVIDGTTVVAEIEIPGGVFLQPASTPTAIAVARNSGENDDLHAMYVTDTEKDSVIVISANSRSNNPRINLGQLRDVIPVGDQPQGIAYDPANQKIFVTNYGSNSVSIFDTNLESFRPREIVTSEFVGNGPRGIAYNPDDNLMYVVNELDGSVVRVNFNGKVVDEPPIRVGMNPWDIAYNEADKKMYVTNSGDNTVSIISPVATTSRPITRPLEAVIPVGQEPLGIAFNPTSNTMYVTNHASHSVSVISSDTNTVTATIPARGSVDLFGPHGIAFNAEIQRMYVANQQGDNTVSTLDGTTIEDTITVGAAPTGVAFESANDLVYVTNLQDSTVSVISGNTVTDTIEVGGNPFGVATNTANTKVYVTSGVDNNFVSIIDDGNILTKTIEIGASPLGIAFNPINNKMYVANYGNDSISVIDVNTDTVTDTITGVRTPVSIAYNPVDRNMYVTNSDSDSITVIEDTRVKTTIPNVGDGPYAIAFNPANQKMYVTNERENTLTVIGRL
jgi:YVTN family beta-propeller protein